MSEAIVAVIGLVGSAAGAIWAAYVGTRRRVLAELEAQFDADLRTERLKVYPALWSALEPLAKYAREPPGLPKQVELEHLAEALRRWYFQVGGLYLSVESREAYFALQDRLAAVASDPDDDEFEAIRRLGSSVRTALTYDVGTRRPFSLRNPEQTDRRPPAA